MKPATNVVWCDPALASDEVARIKARQQAMWASSDYSVVGGTLQIVGEMLCEAVDVRAGERVLDVAAGSGNVSLAAARRFADVTATDYVPGLLDRAQARAAAEGFEMTFQVADAEALPFADASFDAVVSTFGVMFAPNHGRAAREMLRVCREGGRIGLASWTPNGFVGQLLRTVGTHVAPIPGVASPALWGTPDHLAALFTDAADIRSVVRQFAFRYRSPEHFVDVFRTYYGPVYKAFGALDERGQAALHDDLVTLLRRSDAGGGPGLVIQGEYLETVVVR